MQDAKTEICTEIEAIDRKAYSLARRVGLEGVERTDLRQSATELSDRLKHLADELERLDPKAYDVLSDIISEAILDLDFVIEDDGKVKACSFRLARALELNKLYKNTEKKDVED